MASRTIGEYLRARREQMRPEEVGIVATGRRRVSGLRRDELAMLAGISTEYYTRLEQGRDHHPSEQVLQALARALRLDEDAAARFHDLATGVPRRRRSRRPERLQPSVQHLLDSWHTTPAFVQGRCMDVLAANALMRAISPMYAPGTNIPRAAFLDSAVRDLFDDPESRLENVVASLRARVGPDVDDPRLTELIGELSLRSEEFRRLWSRREARRFPGGGTHVLHHAQVGTLELRYDTFHLAGTDRQTMTVYQAAPGSRSEQGLLLLASLAADQHRTEPA